MTQVLLLASAGFCPDCPPAREARTLFFQLDFVRNLLFALSPFVVTLGLVLLIVRAVSTRTAKGIQ